MKVDMPVTVDPVNATQTVTVNYATSDGTAVAAHQDYVPVAGTLVFQAGQDQSNITLLMSNDLNDEVDENFTVTYPTPKTLP